MEYFRDLTYEGQYISILKKIDQKGYEETNQRTGVKTMRIPHAAISVDLGKEFPILTCKQVFWKSALKEILWIMQKQSNNINDLGAHIWDDWADKYGSIGKSYGYQVRKGVKTNGRFFGSQVHYVLETLQEDPSDRRCLIDLWNVDDLGEMNLVPCCYSSHWTIVDGRLNCFLTQRSCDFLVGVPFNTTQYAMLTIMFAQHLGVKPGELTHVMSDVHYYCYESHLAGKEKMKKNYIQMASELAFKDPVRFTVAQTELNGGTNFFDITLDHCSLENYHWAEKIPFDVAV